MITMIFRSIQGHSIQSCCCTFIGCCTFIEHEPWAVELKGCMLHALSYTLSVITSLTCSNFWNLACQGSRRSILAPKWSIFYRVISKKKFLGEGKGGGWAMPPDPPYVLHVYTCDFSCTTFTQLAMALVSEYFIVQDLIVYCPSLHTTHTCAYAYHRLLPLCTVRSRCKV